MEEEADTRVKIPSDKMKYRAIIAFILAIFIVLTLLTCGFILAYNYYKLKNSNKIVDFRLPKDLVPSYYDIKIYTNFHGYIKPSHYNGTVKIYFRCVKETSMFVLNARYLEIKSRNSITIQDETENMKLKFVKLVYDSEADAHFLSAKMIKPFQTSHNYSVTIKFKGFLKDDNSGFYRLSYTDSENKNRWFMASQMQPIDARKAFPCFDEPWMKARFKITTVHHKTYSALSNMPVLSVKQTSDGLVETEFEVSVPMSTYLIALIISDFKCKHGIANAGPNGSVNVSVCGRPEANNQFEFSLNKSIKLLEEYESHFGVKYPLTKCDHVGLPDFLFLGMENWGLITYRETHLFFPDGSSTFTQAASWIYDVLIHEIAHIWFGNLVTPEWWDDLWLSEGFSTFAHVEPYGVLLLNSIFQIDVYSSSYPIYMPIKKPAHTEQIFNEMVYLKAAIIARMLKFVLGKDLYHQSITEINKHGGIPIPDIASIIKTWIMQSGYPVVHIETINSTAIKVTQEQCLLDPSVIVTKNIAKSKWYIPFTFTIKDFEVNMTFNNTQKNKKPEIKWLLPLEEYKIINIPQQLQDDQFILGNINIYGFYRVNYDMQNWNKILHQLKTDHRAISTDHRVQIVTDIFMFIRNGILNPTFAFELLDYIKDETEAYIWRFFIINLKEISNILKPTKASNNFNAFVKKFVNKTFMESRYGNMDSSTNEFLLAYACELEIPECLDMATQLFKPALEYFNYIRDMPEFMTCNKIRYGKIADWEWILDAYQNQNDTVFRKHLQYALSCTKEPLLLERYLNDQINETIVKRYDCLAGISNVAKQQNGSFLVWKFVKRNWPLIYSKFGHSNIIEFNTFLTSITDGFNTVEQLSDFIQFFQNNPDHELINSQIAQSIEKIRANIKWGERNAEKILEWIKSRDKYE